jgi:hypothetical protein
MTSWLWTFAFWWSLCRHRWSYTSNQRWSELSSQFPLKSAPVRCFRGLQASPHCFSTWMRLSSPETHASRHSWLLAAAWWASRPVFHCCFSWEVSWAMECAEIVKLTFHSHQMQLVLRLSPGCGIIGSWGCSGLFTCCYSVDSCTGALISFGL